jgi:hypothetical protein
MRTLLSILVIFLTKFSFGQSQYFIKYTEPTRLNILYEDTIANEIFYSVEFLNSENKAVKNITRKYEDDHSTKRDFAINNYVIYYFYFNTLLTKTISIDPDFHKFYLTKHFFDQQGNYLGWENYSIKPKISKDSFTRILNADYFLNNPQEFPTKNLTLETKEIKKYDSGRLIYKCYYEKYGKMKEALPARESFYKYNVNRELVEHISNPKSDAGGTAFLRSTYEYNNKNQVTVEQSYSDGKHGWTTEFEYTDSTIIKLGFSLDEKGEKHYQLYKGVQEPEGYKIVYRKREDGIFYNDYGFRFSLTNGDE